MIDLDPQIGYWTTSLSRGFTTLKGRSDLQSEQSRERSTAFTILTVPSKSLIRSLKADYRSFLIRAS